MDYLRVGIVKILDKTPIWNLVYPLLFGFLISNPFYLFGLSSIITIHIFILAYYDADLNGETPVYMLLSYIGLPLIIYISFFETSSWIKSTKHSILVKMGRRIPDNWDDEKL